MELSREVWRTKVKSTRLKLTVITLLDQLLGKKFSRVSHLYQNLNFFKLNDIYKLELAKIKHKFRRIILKLHLKIDSQKLKKSYTCN